MVLTRRTVALAAVLVVAVLAVGVVAGSGIGAGGAVADQSTTTVTEYPDCTLARYNGSGTASDPWEIENVRQLQCMGNLSTITTLSEDYELVSDVDATGTDEWGVGSPRVGFEPRGSFSGTFDGNGHTIRGLYTAYPRIRLGMFERVESGAVVEDVTFENARIRSGSDVGVVAGLNSGTIRRVATIGSVESSATNGGGIAGVNDGTIADSYSTASVDVFDHAGGITGFVDGGLVSDSYATGDVDSNESTGGLVGRVEFSGTVERSYATGTVTGNTFGGFDNGGLVGYDDGSGTVTDSYWNTETSGQSSSAGGTGLTTDEMIGADATSNMGGLDFTTTWDVLTFGSDRARSFPFLRTPTQSPAPGLYAGGDGSASNPYEIANWYHLDNVRENPGANFTLANDLNSSTTGYGDVAAPTANGGQGLLPIGNSTTPFTGTFEGANYTIADLTIDRPSTSQVGLFGVVDTGGRVANLTVANATVTGGSSTGMLAGVSTDTVVGVEVSGTVEGDTSVGGVVAKNVGGTVRDASAAGTVTGNGDVGGIVGTNRNGGTVENVAATATVEGSSDEVGGLVGRQVGSTTLRNGTADGDVNGSSTSDDVGGAVGYSEGAVENVSATGTVSGNNRVGGVIGTSNSPFTVANVSATGNVTGDLTVGGAIGEVAGGTVANVSASGAVEGVDKVGGLAGRNNGGIRDGYARGSVTASTGRVGGLVGANPGDVLRAYATGSVTGDDTVGGLVGANAGTVEEAYAVGSVTGNTSVGGLVGTNSGTVTDGYWDTETTGQSGSAGGTGLTTDEMLGDAAKTNMGGFDFARSWAVVDADGEFSYPYLLNETQSPAPGLQSVYAGGNGTSGDPFLIADWYDLANVSARLGANFTLANDLDASTAGYGDVAAPGANGGSGFAPLGDSTTPFTGTFEGANYTIADLTIDRPSTSQVGLFGVVDTGGRVANLTVANATVTGGSSTGILAGVSTATVAGVDVSGSVQGGGNSVGGVVGNNFGGTVRDASAAGTVVGNREVGGIVGINRNGGTVESVTATATVEGSGNEVGGLVGRQVGSTTLRNGTADGDVNGSSTSSDVGGAVGYSEGAVENVSATGTVNGNNRVGGVIGTSNSPFTVANVSATGNVTGDFTVGGAIGEVAGGTVANVSASGDVEGIDDVGGLVGRNNDALRDGYATGSVTASTGTVGGLVGDNQGDVLRAYATGSVTGDDTVGGLVGNNAGTVEEAYAVGNVTGNTSVGGLVGTNSGTVTDGYWDTETTGQSGSAGGTGLTTDEMLGDAARTNMSGFDFARSWAVVDNGTDVSYPYLQNNTQSPAPGLREVFAGGDGSASNPYEIANWNHLENVRTDLDANYTLVADLNASTAGYDDVAAPGANGGQGFDPIGNYTEDSVGIFTGTAFTGTFDGADHTISDLFVDLSTTGVGLFAVVETDGTVGNLSLANATVRGDATVGGIVGQLRGGTLRASSVGGTVGDSAVSADDVGGIAGEINAQIDTAITESYTTADVESGGGSVGGVVGVTKGVSGPTVTVTDAYVTGNVTGDTDVGGVVGVNNFVVRDVYAVGAVSGSTNVGGVVGDNSGGDVVDTYFDANATGQSAGIGNPAGGTNDATGLTTAEMLGDAAKTNLGGFDFTNTWTVVDNGTYLSYPYLRNDAQTPPPGLRTVFAGGNGSASDPFQIADWYDLNQTRNDLGANYTLTNDLNRTSAGYDDVANATANGGKGFVPIGNSSDWFTGTFDGDDHAITGLTIDRGGEDYVGLFGYVRGSGSVIANVTLDDASVTGNEFVGSLVGLTWSGDGVRSVSVTVTVEGSRHVGGVVGFGRAGGGVVNASADGTVSTTTGIEGVGGVVGSTNSGGVTDSTADVDVYAADANRVGGLVGQIYLINSGIEGSSATGTVRGNDEVGGLAGYNTEPLSDSYATGNVTGNDSVGGLVGNNTGTIENGSAAGNVTAGNGVGGLVGENAGTIRDGSATGNVTASDRVGGLVGDSTGTVRNGSATGRIAASTAVGGLVGSVSKGGLVTGSRASGPVEGSSDVGGLIGRLTDGGSELYDSGARGAVNGTGSNVGGLVGAVSGNPLAGGPVLEDVRATGTVDAPGATAVGGLVGEASDVVTVTAGSATGNVTGDAEVGGLFGRLESGGSLVESNATGVVDGTTDVGGLVGVNGGSIRNSTANGSVTGGDRVGGLVGNNPGVVEIAYARVDVIASGDLVGGLVGENAGTINEAYAAGLVDAPAATNVGGLVGANGGTIASSYYDTNVTNRSDTGAGFAPLTTAEMTDVAARSNVTGFDFAGHWDVRPENYPVFEYLPVAPTGVNDSYTTAEDVNLTVSESSGVIANDADPDDDGITAAVVSPPANGSLTLRANGSLVYDPDRNFDGNDSFTYEVDDGVDGTDTATVRIAVTAVNDPPVARNDSYATDEDTTLTVTAANGTLANDTDAEGATLNASLVSGPANGTLTLAANGSFTYEPATDFAGTDTFRYNASDGSLNDTATVTISVGPVNDPPNASDDSYVTTEDTNLTVTAANGTLANDTDVDGDVLNASLVSGPSNGTLALAANGSFTYDPDRNFNGVDSFRYNASDGSLNDTATVTITVTAVDDPPVARNDSYSTPEDTTLTVTAANGTLANDTDAEGATLNASLVSGPANGTLSLAANGSFTYEPDPMFNGVDSFRYNASDGSLNDTATVTISVGPVNDPPNASADSYTTREDRTLMVTAANGTLANDADPGGDSLNASLVSGPSNGTLALAANGNFTYDPAADFAGTDTFTYNASDGSLNDTATVTIAVTPVDDRPVARNDSYATPEDTTLWVTAANGTLANDTDVDGDALNASLVSAPANGTLTLFANGSFTYEPDSMFNGRDSFRYNASDGSLNDTATVTIAVGAVNDRPVARNDSYVTRENTTLAVSAANGTLANDTDAEGATLNASLVSGPAHGTLTLAANGSFEYTPDSGFSGTDSFVYAASDGNASDRATVTITVEETVADVSVAIDSTNSPVTEGDPLRVTATVENVGNGTGTRTIALREFDGTAADSQRVTLGPGENRTVTLAWATGFADTGTGEVVVDSGDDTARQTVTVEQARSDVSVAIDATTSPVVEGDRLSVTAVVENVGDGPADQTIALSVGGTTRDSRAVTLAPGERRRITLDWATGDGDAGSYTATVRSANDSASTGVEVLAAGSLQVGVDDVTSPVMEGDTVTVTAAVSNPGTTGTTGTVTLSQGGTTVETRTVSLSAGGSTTVELTWATSEGEAGDYALTVATANDSATAAVDVRAKDRDVPACRRQHQDPRDPDDDGHYEDVDGSGHLSGADVQRARQCLGTRAAEEYPLAYDFDDDGEFTSADLDALAEEIEDRGT